MAKRALFTSLLMWLLPLSFFTYQFILRLWPSLMMQDIMQQFAIDATAFGVLASCYYYGYASMQLPVAIMLDRYGARVVVGLCAICCGFATLSFTYTDNWYIALMSRFAVGAASAVGFLGVSKVISEWFAKEDYSRMVGFSFSVGLLGALYAGKPVGMLIAAHGGQVVAYYLAIFAIVIGLTCLALLRSNHVGENSGNAVKLSDLRMLLASRNIWLLAIANLLMVGSLEGFADVWGLNYLMTAYHFTKPEAAELTSFIFVGMLFGGPTLALCANRFGNYNVIASCGLLMASIFFVLLFSMDGDWYKLMALFFVLGILCCYQVLVFAAGYDLVATHLLGVAVAFLNCINMLGGSFFHTLIGAAMDMAWHGDINDLGLRVYDVTAYKAALLIIPVCSLIGAVLVLLVQKKSAIAKDME